MNRSVVWGIAIIILLGAAVLAGGESQAPATAKPEHAAPQDDLTRCQAMGEAAGNDAACRAAWAAARARFFGRAAS